MSAAWLALALFGGYVLLTFGLRALVQRGRTGDTGFRGVSGRPGSAEWWGGVLFAVALLTGVLGPVAGLLGLEPLVTGHGIEVAGTTLTVAGIGGTFLTQLAMGDSWRVGVDETERTELVTGGPFAVVRNPIFTAMLATGAGLVLIVPNAVAVVGWLLLLLAVELQVRVVEEPYLRRAHGADYVRYLGQVGRFVPLLGREQERPTARGLDRPA